MIGVNLVKRLVIGSLVFVFVSANAGIGSITSNSKEKSSYIDITYDKQYMEVSDGKQWDGTYNDTTVHLDESYGWLIEYVSPDDEIEMVERVELAGPSEWDLSSLPPDNPFGIISQSHQILEEGRILETKSVWRNTGKLFSAYTVIAGDPEGEAQITIRVNDRVARTYSWNIIPERRKLPFPFQ